MSKLAKTHLVTLNEFIKLQGAFNVDMVRRVDGHDIEIDVLHKEMDALRTEVISSAKSTIKILKEYLNKKNK